LHNVVLIFVEVRSVDHGLLMPPFPLFGLVFLQGVVELEAVLVVTLATPSDSTASVCCVRVDCMDSVYMSPGRGKCSLPLLFTTYPRKTIVQLEYDFQNINEHYSIAISSSCSAS
jgi:hypothetical protein